VEDFNAMRFVTMIVNRQTQNRRKPRMACIWVIPQAAQAA
jgi:hypothetical protein